MRWRGDRNNRKRRRERAVLRGGVRTSSIVHNFTKGVSISGDREAGERRRGLGVGEGNTCGG